LNGARQRLAEAVRWVPPIDGVDVVGEAEDALRVGVVVLDADFHGNAVALVFHVDRLFMQDLLAALRCLMNSEMPPEYLNSTDLASPVLAVGGALVGERDNKALVKKSQLAQPLRQRIEIVFRRSENGTVGQEADFGPTLFGGACLFSACWWDHLWSSSVPGKAARQISRLNSSLSAFTQETRRREPAGNLVGGRVDFPPAWSVVITTWAAGIFSPSISIMSTADAAAVLSTR